MESGRNIISFSFPSNGISSLHNVVPHPLPRLPLIDIYCINSQGAKSTFSSGNEGCSVERYNRLVEEHGNGVEFITDLIPSKNANQHLRGAEGGHNWYQKEGPKGTDIQGYEHRKFKLSHGRIPCQKHGFRFELLERRNPHSYPVAYCTLTRKRTRSTISPAVVPSGDVNSYLSSGISSFHGDHVNYQGSTSILSGAPIMSMAADSTARMPIVPPGDVYSSLSDATSSFNYGHHFLDSGAYMSMEVNSVPASMPSNCPLFLMPQEVTYGHHYQYLRDDLALLMTTTWVNPTVL